MSAVADLDGLRFDLSPTAAHSIAISMDFDGPQPSFFGAPPAQRKPLSSGSFTGDTREGGSCNCEVLEIIPHCNGTHTECVGHITDDRATVPDLVGNVLVPALLLSLEPGQFAASGERGPGPAEAGDPVISRARLRAAWETAAPGIAPAAIILRTLPNAPEKCVRDWMSGPPSTWLTAEAAEWLAGQGICHLLTDQPSVDRPDDGGELLAHRSFWGLPEGTRDLSRAAHPHASITEMVFVPDTIEDGLWLLNLQYPPLETDAVPSRPILHPQLSD